MNQWNWSSASKHRVQWNWNSNIWLLNFNDLTYMFLRLMYQMNAQLNVCQSALLELNATIPTMINSVSFCIEICGSNMVGVVSFHCFFLKMWSSKIQTFLVTSLQFWLTTPKCIMQRITPMLLHVHTKFQINISMQLKIILWSLY